MSRVGVACALLLAVAHADEVYDRLLAEADRILWGAPADVPLPVRIDRAYLKLAEAAQADSERWEAYFERGLNRCRAALYGHARLLDALNHARVSGSPAREVRTVEQTGARWIEERLGEARRDLQTSLERMRALGQWDPDRVLFANAALKLAARHFLKGRRNEPGAIDDLKELTQRRYRPDACREQLALCYLELGQMAYERTHYEKAREHWDEALRWARRPELRRVLLINKAGAFDMDDQFARAEEVLRQVIEIDPADPGVWKNLGFVVGFQTRLKEAAYCYRRARELCGTPTDPGFQGPRHGNAWLRAAMIHGNLLEEDGELRTAWRLFLEYRAMCGEDYNFSLWFGEFLANHRQYDLAWRYLTRARDLQPRCTLAYQSLVQIAPRRSGTRAQARERITAAETALDQARARFDARAETAAVQRICSGLHDLADGGAPPSYGSRLEPDPLAGLSPEQPPAWLLEAAREREPFQPWEPDRRAGSEHNESAAPGPEESHLPDRRRWIVAVACGLLAAGAVAAWLLLRRRRRRA
jgi:tetratricopeptide (TPR) repeat protein